ncbi:hypothetical protein ANRL4_03810 [Anaerolineae bacterium]|nr:hypothetical protein ANRL4_03810 [Anaerolineae bacterium]
MIQNAQPKANPDQMARRSAIFFAVLLAFAFLLMPWRNATSGPNTGMELLRIGTEYGAFSLLIFLVPLAALAGFAAGFSQRIAPHSPTFFQIAARVGGAAGLIYVAVAMIYGLQTTGSVGGMLSVQGMGIWVTLFTAAGLIGLTYNPNVTFIIVWIGVSFFFVQGIRREMTLFPLWSSIAFPMLTISPFLVLSIKMPRAAQIALLVLVVCVLLPMVGIEDTFYLELIIQISIFAAMAIGLNIVIGFAGLLDLGYIAFFAVGAYLWGMFTSTAADTVFKTSNALASPDAFWLFLLLGVIAAGITGVLLGLPVLRLRGDYLAIVTLGFGEIIRILVSNLSNISSNPIRRVNLTNGAQGLPGIAHPILPQGLYDLVKSIAAAIGVPLNTQSSVEAVTLQLFFYFLVLTVGGIAVIIAARLDNSPIGRAWTAIREDEVAAVAMGVPRVRMKLLAFAMGASFAGAMGVIFAAKQSFVSPESFSFIQSIFILVIVIVGGMGSIRGVLLGAVVVTLLNLQVLKNFSLLINSLKNLDWVVPIINFPIRNWPSQLEPARYERLVFGVLLIVMMIYRPEGISPAKRRRMEMQEAADQTLEEAAAEGAPRPGMDKIE